MLSDFNLNQFNVICNHNNVILDLALFNVHIIVPNDPDPFLLIDNHHLPLNILFNYKQFNTLPIYDTNNDLKKLRLLHSYQNIPC